MLNGDLRRSGEPRITDFQGPIRRTQAKTQTFLTPERSAEMVALYADGIPSVVLAERFGVCRDTVISHVRRADAVPGRVREITEINITEMVARYQAGVGLDRIGLETHVGSDRVREALVGAGVEIRPQHGGRDRDGLGV